MLIIIRRLSSVSANVVAARVYRDGSPIMFVSEYPFQGIGETSEEAVGMLCHGYSDRLRLIHGCRRPIGNNREEILEFGREILESQMGNRNFDISIELHLFWR